MDSDNILMNVRGLRSQVRRSIIMDLVAQERISLVCLQETKLSSLDLSTIMSICGSGFEYCFLPVDCTRGGIMVTWHASAWSLSLVAEAWWITAVYGPQGEHEKLLFL
jgi:exonuclease III